MLPQHILNGSKTREWLPEMRVEALEKFGVGGVLLLGELPGDRRGRGVEIHVRIAARAGYDL